jgi:hypothetical protein
MSATMFISMQAQTGSRNDARLARSLTWQRRKDAEAHEREMLAAAEREEKWGSNDMSGRQSLMKALGSPARVTRLTSWAGGVPPAAPWRDVAALTQRYSPKPKRTAAPAYATI